MHNHEDELLGKELISAASLLINLVFVGLLDFLARLPHLDKQENTNLGWHYANR